MEVGKSCEVPNVGARNSTQILCEGCTTPKCCAISPDLPIVSKLMGIPLGLIKACLRDKTGWLGSVESAFHPSIGGWRVAAFQASLVYRGSSKTAKATQRTLIALSLRKKKKKAEEAG